MKAASRFAPLSAAVLVVLIPSVITSGPAAADDSGNFLLRLGQDTTSVEHYTRTPSKIEVNQVGRAPRVLQRHFTYDFEKGAVTKFEMVVAPPGSPTPTQTVHGGFVGDSLRLDIQSGTQPVQHLSVKAKPGIAIVPLSSPWAPYEAQIAKLAAGKSDSLRTQVYFLGSDVLDWLSIHKLGRDSVALTNTHNDVFHVSIDKAGHVLGVLPISGTAKFSVERLANLDVDAMGAAFAAREQAAGALGQLSPRDSVVTTAGGASIWIDYGRPSKRGRVIFGNVVPYGEVWRTGANAATQFKTDKALDFGGVVVPPGFYTLWTLPSPNGWKLIVNSETGQWGTAHKADKDLYKIDMKTVTLPQSVEHFTISVEPGVAGGTMNLDWDTTRATVQFAVKP
jgi:Protein of unknown function (DUF2911)